MIINCRECDGKISDLARYCVHCGAPPGGFDPSSKRAIPDQIRHVIVRNLDVGFLELVSILVKLAFAIIPAIIIVAVITGLVVLVLGIRA